MQAQQLYNELKRVRHELDKSREEKEDLREELREMTQFYLMMKQERDKYRQQIDYVKKDYENMDKIIKENVDRALKQREKYFTDLQKQLKDQQDKINQLESHKKCYSNTINYLESQITNIKDELMHEKEKNQKLQAEVEGKENVFIQANGGMLYDEKNRLKQLQYEDDVFISKYNKNELLEQTNFDDGGRPSALQGQPDKDGQVRTTEGDDCSYDEATNCRLREETHASMMFALDPNTAPVNLNQIQLSVKNDGSAKKVNTKLTPAKVAPMESQKQMFDHPEGLEETKTAPKGHKEATDFMLSQDSIKLIEEAADQETKEERQKLEAIEKQKREFAKLLRQKQDTEFKQKQDQTTQDRLKYLLKQSEIFTHFILSQKAKPGQNLSSAPPGILADDLDQFKQKLNQVSRGRDAGGKSSVSKRHQKKSAKLIDEDAEIASDQVLTRLDSQPSILKGGQLRDYQLDGLNWLIGLYETGINGILADEMLSSSYQDMGGYLRSLKYKGLGKTVQTISLVAFLREFKHVNGYHIVISTKSTIPNFMNVFAKWCPEVRVVNLIARKEQREEILKTQLQPGKFDVVVTTFEGCRICLPNLLKFKWEYLIIDEAHKIKNEESQISQKLRQLDSRYRLLLTGTPLQNNLHELWSLLNFLLPEVFSSAEDFDEWFDLSKGGENMTDQEREQRNSEIIQQLHKILRPFLLRRIKKEVEKNLPPKVEIHVNVGITEQQKLIYRQLLKKSTIEKGTSVSYFKNIIIQLRKICNHPYLFDGQEPEGADEFGEHIIKASGKMLFLDKLLKKVKEEQSQVLIFSGFTSMLDILEDYCIFREYKYCRLDGNTELDDRERYIEEFTKEGSEKFIFLISTRAGGLGLNLMTANIVVLYDSDWNPQMDLQAMDRAHRIGQKRVVKVFRLVTQNTMEEKMIEKQTMKLKLDSLIIQKGRMAPKHTGLQKDELQDMVNYGADQIFKVGSDVQDEDIEEIIQKGEEKALNMQKEAEQIVKNKFDMLDFSMNAMNMYQFEDVDYLQEKRKEQQQTLQKHIVNMLNEEVRGGRREKKMASMNLNESKLFPKFFQGGAIGVSNETKKKKLLKVQDFRFFPQPERLKYLLEKELDAKYTGFLQGIEQIHFSEKEREEKDRLWSQGFPEWDRRDYQRFCQALEFCSPDDYVAISQHVGTKTPEQVEKYSKVFVQNIDTLADVDKVKKNMEKADKIISFKTKAPQIIRSKVMAYESPLDQMVIYATQKSKYFSKESDIILICLTDQIGYGKWREIKKAIRRDSRCRFDHLFLSRNEQELQRRVDILVKALEKEEETNKKKLLNTVGIDDGQNQLEDQDVIMNDLDDDMDDSEESKTISKPKKANNKKTNNQPKPQQMRDVTLSEVESDQDMEMDVEDANNTTFKKQDKQEENKYSHLKDQEDFILGGGTVIRNGFDHDEESSNQFTDQKFKKLNGNGKSKNSSNHGSNSLKQSKLQFGSNSKQQLIGLKRSQPDEDDLENSVNKIDMEDN